MLCILFDVLGRSTDHRVVSWWHAHTRNHTHTHTHRQNKGELICFWPHLATRPPAPTGCRFQYSSWLGPLGELCQANDSSSGVLDDLLHFPHCEPWFCSNAARLGPLLLAAAAHLSFPIQLSDKHRLSLPVQNRRGVVHVKHSCSSSCKPKV